MTHPEAAEIIRWALRAHHRVHVLMYNRPRQLLDSDIEEMADDILQVLVAAGWAPRWEAERDNDRKWCDIIDSAGERPDGVEFTPAVLDAIRAQECQVTAELIAAAIEAYPGARGPAIDDPRDPRRAGLDTARRIARDLGKAATT